MPGGPAPGPWDLRVPDGGRFRVTRVVGAGGTAAARAAHAPAPVRTGRRPVARAHPALRNSTDRAGTVTTAPAGWTVPGASDCSSREVSTTTS